MSGAWTRCNGGRLRSPSLPIARKPPIAVPSTRIGHKHGENAPEIPTLRAQLLAGLLFEAAGRGRACRGGAVDSDQLHADEVATGRLVPGALHPTGLRLHPMHEVVDGEKTPLDEARCTCPCTQGLMWG